jgi:hypothetical protein
MERVGEAAVVAHEDVQFGTVVTTKVMAPPEFVIIVGGVVKGKLVVVVEVEVKNVIPVP